MLSMKLVVFAGLVAAVTSSVILPNVPEFVKQGSCAKVDEARIFTTQVGNHPLLDGLWYEAGLTPNPFQSVKKCVVNEFTYDANTKSFSLWTTGIHADGSLVQRSGTLKPDPTGQPHLLMDYEGISWVPPLVFVDTDYNNFICAYSCVKLNLGHHVDFAFVFSREPVMNEHYYRRCMNAFRNVGVKTERFVRTQQGPDCPYQKQKTLKTTF